MGFSDFLDGASSFFRGAGNGIISGFKGIVSPFSDTITNISKPVVSIVSKIGGTAERVLDRGVDLADRLATSSVNTFSSITSFLSNPLVMVGGAVLALIVVSKVLDSKLK